MLLHRPSSVFIQRFYIDINKKQPLSLNFCLWNDTSILITTHTNQCRTHIKPAIWFHFLHTAFWTTAQYVRPLPHDPRSVECTAAAQHSYLAGVPVGSGVKLCPTRQQSVCTAQFSLEKLIQTTDVSSQVFCLFFCSEHYWTKKTI